MQHIKRFVKGGYLRTAGGVFGRIESAAGKEVTFRTMDGETYTIHKNGAFKTNRAEFNQAVEKYKAEVEVAAPEPRTIVADSYRRRYQNVRSVNNNSSKICGDRISKMLHGKTLQEVAGIVAEYTGDSAADLLSRYEHLNPGQRRMNIGNRLRHWAKKNAPDFFN